MDKQNYFTTLAIGHLRLPPSRMETGQVRPRLSSLEPFIRDTLFRYDVGQKPF